MDIQLKPNTRTSRVIRGFFSLFFVSILFSTASISKDYKEDAYRSGTGYSSSSLSVVRESDLLFVFPDPLCCCFLDILEIFKDDTEYITSKKVNPATDNFISSLAMIKESNDIMRKRISNLKQINGMYSFSDTGEFKVSMTKPEGFSNMEGCIPIDFNTAEGREDYLKVIDSIEAGGSYTQEGHRSSAYGRYQFMPDTASEYCSRVPAGLNCCGDAWKSSATCQDEMFLSFTANNIKGMGKNVPVNSCNIYMVHQQGLGGFNWLQGGKNPYGSLNKLKNVTKANVSDKAWNEAEAAGLTNSEDGLRQIMNKYWSDKFGGDIHADIGDKNVSMEEFTKGVDQFTQDVEELKEARKKMLRKGILLELKRENWHIDTINNAFDLKNSSRTTEIKNKLNIKDGE